MIQLDTVAFNHDASAATYLRWSWILFVPGTVIGGALLLSGLFRLLA